MPTLAQLNGIDWDLSSFTDEDQQRIVDATTAYKEEVLNAAQCLIVCGHHLKTIHDVFKQQRRLPAFFDYCKDIFGRKQAHIYNAMQIWERFGDRIHDEKNLLIAAGNMAYDALVELARDDAPKEIVDEIIKSANKGENWTKKKVQERIDEAHEEAAYEQMRAEQEEDDWPLEDQMQAENEELEYYAHQISQFYKSAPRCKWLDKERLEILRSALAEAAATVREAKGYHACRICNGDDYQNCTKCKRTGWQPKTVYQSYGGI